MHPAMRWFLPMIVSTLVLAAMFYSDESDDPGVPSGNLILSMAISGIVTAVLFMPTCGLAGLLQRLLKWPPWTRLAILFGVWVMLFTIAALFLGRDESGIRSAGDVFRAALQFWLPSLAYGLPSLLLYAWGPAIKVPIGWETEHRPEEY
jgi:hypothetical protein